MRHVRGLDVPSYWDQRWRNAVGVEHGRRFWEVEVGGVQ